MTPDMWPDILRKAKEGGINLIQTYVFWNIHEPQEGKFNFEGNYDLVKYIKTIADAGLYCTLRVGPYIEAEWNFGGFPYWLKEVPGIVFRSDNEPFKYHMQKFVTMIIDMMKKENLFAPQGGPIIMAQIENEYNNVQLAYREKGQSYVQWAGNMALSLNAGVPWIMCKQREAPGPVINTCNGRHCAKTWSGPNSPDKPALWTENWTAQYRVFGDPPSQRAAEDIATAVAHFFAKNGTLTNYYMYFGGTNFGRTASSFVTTRYYDEAPLDEFGLKREPKFSHLRDLHRALKLTKKALLWGTPIDNIINQDVEIVTFEKPGTEICAAFLINNNTRIPLNIPFRGQNYFLPAESISILPDCKTVVLNTQQIVAQHNSRNFVPSVTAKGFQWEMTREPVPVFEDLPIKSKEPLELYAFTKDTSDYAWYTTSIHFERRDLPIRSDIFPVLQIANLGHAMVVFVNGEYVGFKHGSNVEKSFAFEKPVTFKPGKNTISLLCMTVGLPNSGAYMERRFAGVRGVTIQGMMAGTLDVTENTWAQEVGVKGEKSWFFTEEGSKTVQWTPAKGAGPPITWYKTYFEAPEGNNPVAIRMTSMGKGMVWVNGNSIGRYWVNYLSPLGKPTQSEYHIPRAFLKPGKNLLVVFEETGGNPDGIEILLVNRDTICSFISDIYPPRVDSWEREGEKIKTTVPDAVTGATLTCPEGRVIKTVDFASYGDPFGSCGAFAVGKCNDPNAKEVVERQCLGKPNCFIPLKKNLFEDKCPEVSKTLAVQVLCG
ncbi:Beta-galactosidase [Bertholletia excelsa]